MKKRRKEIVKRSKKKLSEEAKVSVRAVRRDGMDEAKTMQKEGLMTEDELRNSENDIQKATDKYIAEIDKLTEEKEKEVMSL